MTSLDDAHQSIPDPSRDRHEHPPALMDMMQVVMRIGTLMLRSGTVSFRVEQAMNRVAVALGADHLDSYVTLSGITASIHKNNEHYTQIARIKSIGVDMNRLSTAERLSQTIPANTSPALLTLTLDRIEQLPSVYPLPFRVIAVALACGAFALLNGGGLIEFGAAAIGAGVGQIVQIYLKEIQLHSIAITILCATTATLMCHVVLSILAILNTPSQFVQPAFLSAVIFLVPGMALVTASLDLIRFDILSGIVRASYALMQMFAVAIGILLVAPLINQSIF